MIIEFEDHSNKRLNERRVERIWVEDTIKWPDRIKRYGKKFHAIKRFNNNILKVIYTREKHINIKTVYWLK